MIQFKHPFRRTSSQLAKVKNGDTEYSAMQLGGSFFRDCCSSAAAGKARTSECLARTVYLVMMSSRGKIYTRPHHHSHNPPLPHPHQQNTTMAKSKPIGLKWRSSTLFIVSTVGIGLFTDLFLYGLVVPILPFILQDRVNLPHDKIQSHVSGLLAAYAGASVLFSLPAGILADRLPTRQLPFLVGLTALLLATLLLFLGQNVAVLTVARVLQGISAAVVWTIGLALVLDTVGPENLGKTIGSVRLLCLGLRDACYARFDLRE